MHMANVTKSVLLLVKSVNGISHNPKELSFQVDMEKSENVLLGTVLSADEESEHCKKTCELCYTWKFIHFFFHKKLPTK